MSIPAASVESSVLVVAPHKALGVALAILLMELSLAMVAPWLLLLLRTTAQQRREMQTLSRSIASLRAASNRLNSPATFAEYAKVQRTLQHELKRQQQLQADIAGGGAMPGPAAAPIRAMQQFALNYGIKMLVYFLCFLFCWGSTLFIVPVSGWMTLLNYTPLRFVLGEVGVVPWLAICAFVASSVKQWL
jgi:Flp pilus assembly protein TadB